MRFSRHSELPTSSRATTSKSFALDLTKICRHRSLNPEIINVKILAQHYNVPTLERIRFFWAFFLIDHVTLEVEN